MLATTTRASEASAQPAAPASPPLWSVPLHMAKDKVESIWNTVVTYREAGKCEHFAAVLKPTEHPHIQLGQFETAVSHLPSLRMLQAAGAVQSNSTTWSLQNADLYRAIQLVSFKEFHSTLREFLGVMKSGLHRSQAWLGNMPAQFGDIENAAEFTSYSQKLVVEPGTRCILMGDLHGDLHSLVDFLKKLQQDGVTQPDDPLKLKKPIHLFFLGDYVDRGAWGLEVIYLIMLLKIKNPDQVFFTRGNHEDPEMADRLGFQAEYKAKFGAEDPELKGYRLLSNFYNSMPAVLYLGSGTRHKINFIQCCHGGMEWGYNPKGLINSEDHSFENIPEFKRKTGCPLHDLQVGVKDKAKTETKPFQEVCVDYKPIQPKDNGFVSNEFHLNPTDQTIYDVARRVFTCNKALTEAVLAAASEGKNRVFTVERAHQHAPSNPLMIELLKTQGCLKLWDPKSPIVNTLLLSPDSDSGVDQKGLGRFNSATIQDFITGEEITDWKDTVTNIPIFPKAE